MHSILAWNVQNYDAPPLLVGRGFLPLAIAASRLQTLAIFPTHMFTIMRKTLKISACPESTPSAPTAPRIFCTSNMSHYLKSLKICSGTQSFVELCALFKGHTVTVWLSIENRFSYYSEQFPIWQKQRRSSQPEPRQLLRLNSTSDPLSRGARAATAPLTRRVDMINSGEEASDGNDCQHSLRRLNQISIVLYVRSRFYNVLLHPDGARNYVTDACSSTITQLFALEESHSKPGDVNVVSSAFSFSF